MDFDARDFNEGRDIDQQGFMVSAAARMSANAMSVRRAIPIPEMRSCVAWICLSVLSVSWFRTRETGYTS